MGMFDSIFAPFRCPVCSWYDMRAEHQTKDLECVLRDYRPLWSENVLYPGSEEWELDRLSTSWLEDREKARLPKEFLGLKEVNVSVLCRHCGFHKRDNFYDGKFKVVDGFLVGEAVDLVLFQTKYKHIKSDKIGDGKE